MEYFIYPLEEPVYVEECLLCTDWMTEGRGCLRRKEPLLPRTMTVVDQWGSHLGDPSRVNKHCLYCKNVSDTTFTKCTTPYHSSYHRPKAAWSKAETIGVFVPHMLWTATLYVDKTD